MKISDFLIVFSLGVGVGWWLNRQPALPTTISTESTSEAIESPSPSAPSPAADQAAPANSARPDDVELLRRAAKAVEADPESFGSLADGIAAAASVGEDEDNDNDEAEEDEVIETIPEMPESTDPQPAEY